MQVVILIFIASVMLILVIKINELNGKINRVQRDLERHDEITISALKSIFEDTEEDIEFLEKIKQLIKGEK